MSKDKDKSSSIILDLSIKQAIERRQHNTPDHQVILPWWFKRNVEEPLSKERYEALTWLMRWLYDNAPEETENIYSETDCSQNIVINPMVIISKEVQEAFTESGFKLIGEADMPDQDKNDIWERLHAGNNFSEPWH